MNHNFSVYGAIFFFQGPFSAYAVVIIRVQVCDTQFIMLTSNGLQAQAEVTLTTSWGALYFHRLSSTPHHEMNYPCYSSDFYRLHFHILFLFNSANKLKHVRKPSQKELKIMNIILFRCKFLSVIFKLSMVHGLVCA